MLSQTAEHALRALLYLAQRGGMPVAAEVVAAAIDAPPNYLSKTLHVLSKQGIVAGTRGPRGGYRLAVDPAQLTVSRVVSAFDERAKRSACLLGDRECSGATPCAAHRRWAAVWEASDAPLRRTTLADLLGGVPLGA